MTCNDNLQCPSNGQCGASGTGVCQCATGFTAVNSNQDCGTCTHHVCLCFCLSLMCLSVCFSFCLTLMCLSFCLCCCLTLMCLFLSLFLPDSSRVSVFVSLFLLDAQCVFFFFFCCLCVYLMLVCLSFCLCVCLILVRFLCVFSLVSVYT